MNNNPPRDYSPLIPPNNLLNGANIPTLDLRTTTQRNPAPPRRDASEESRIQTHMDNGGKLYDASNYARSVQEYTKAIEMMERQAKHSPIFRNEDRNSALDMSLIHPDSGVAYLNRGLSREQLGYATANQTQQRTLLEAAIGDLQQSIRINDSSEHNELAQRRIDGITKYLAPVPAPAMQPRSGMTP